jgi:predicted Zn-dependent protease
MTTGIAAAGGGAHRAFPRRLAVVVLAAATTFLTISLIASGVDRGADGGGRSGAARAAATDTIESLQATVHADPQNAAAWRRLGTAYLRRHIATEDGSIFDQADHAVSRAEALAPDDPATTVARASLLLSQHEFARAREVVEPVTVADPYDSDALTVLADAEIELGHYDGAERALQQLVAVRPGLPAYSRVSYLRELHGDAAGAERAMRQALTAGAGDPFDVATISSLLGDLAFASGDLAAADSRYAAARRLFPSHLGARVGGARVLAARGEDERAVRRLRALLRDVELPSALVLLGDLEARRGNDAAAERQFTKVRASFRDQQAGGTVADLERALFEADHGRAGPALAAAAAAYAARPDNVRVADALAWALVRSGDLGAARTAMERALRLGTTDASVRYHAAVIADAAGDTTTARRELGAAFARNPWFSFSQQENAADLARRLGVPVPDVPSA